MVDIVGINSQSNQPNRVNEKTANKISSNDTKVTNSSRSTGKDSIEISAGAREAQTVKNLVQSAQAEPDVRPDAVAQAKEKLANGGYSGIEVSRQAAKNILGIS